MVRHGDLLIRSIDSVPKDAKRLTHRVLAEGEVTGHSHRLTSGVVLEAPDKSRRYARLAQPALVTHEEHAHIELPAGNYEVVYQREYTPAEIVRVQD
jgi:hypothetical protein